MTKSDNKSVSKLTEWHFYHYATDGAYVLVGKVVGDNRFADGTEIRTSRLLRVDFEKGEAETLNTIYKLG